jgi:replicative superfamily II helicase
MLQAWLNAGKGPALCLCPDNDLIAQTCDQAKQFGIATCTADWDLLDEFINDDKILVASVQKLFNGITRFGLCGQSVGIGTFLMDDAHACANRIREQWRIRIPSEKPAYNALKALFADELERQGLGTYADVLTGLGG